jgi:ABC-type multidrug transport system fused ATPase/permease subunit
MNKLDINFAEKIMVMFLIAISALLTGIILPFIISSNDLSLTRIILLVIIIFYLFVIGMKSIFNYFYVRWRRRHK